MSEPITKPRVSAAAKIVLVLAAAAVLLAVFALAAPGSKFFFPLVSLWCNLAPTGIRMCFFYHSPLPVNLGNTCGSGDRPLRSHIPVLICFFVFFFLFHFIYMDFRCNSQLPFTPVFRMVIPRLP